jgi:uncharacterized protein (TIGR03083 family)
MLHESQNHDGLETAHQEVDIVQGPLFDEFETTAQWVAALASSITGERWSAPGLGVWDVRSLLGHTSRALITVEEYLKQPCDTIDCASTIDYLSGASRADPSMIAERGRGAGAAMGSDPIAYLRDLSIRVPALVRQSEANAIITTIAGGMTLSTYLPSRTVELIVHGCDLSRAIGATVDPPLDALRSVLHLLADTYVATGRGVSFCLAIAGRQFNRSDFEVWPS